MTDHDLKTFLDNKTLQFNNTNFITSDPISIPHQYTRKEDIEIAGFLAALLSWGQRKTIIAKSTALMSLMGNQPYLFLTQAAEKDYLPMAHFKHRTFTGDDCLGIMRGLSHIYLHNGGLEAVCTKGFEKEGAYGGVIALRKALLESEHLKRTEKHLANPKTGSAAKRVNMFFRWMIRNDHAGVDFGLWKGVNPAQLVIPLDLHVGKSARHLGLLHRTQNDWQAAIELTEKLRSFDHQDPVKYDFALFGHSLFDRTKFD